MRECLQNRGPVSDFTKPAIDLRRRGADDGGGAFIIPGRVLKKELIRHFIMTGAFNSLQENCRLSLIFSLPILEEIREKAGESPFSTAY
jgi:hypothetical protein